MPVTLSDADITELDRLLGRFRIDALSEVKAVGDFINAKAKAQQEAAQLAAAKPGRTRLASRKRPQ